MFLSISIEKMFNSIEGILDSALPVFFFIVLRFDGRLQIFNLMTLPVTIRMLHLWHYIDAGEIRMEIRSVNRIQSNRKTHNGILNRF